MKKHDIVSFCPAVAVALWFFMFCLGTELHAQYRTDYAELDESEVVTSFKEHVSFLSSAMLEGRKAGSEGEQEAAAYLYDKFAEYGIGTLSGRDGDEFGLALPGTSDTLVSRNFVGFIQGYGAKLKDRYIVVGARMDNGGVNMMTVDGEPHEQVYYGANGNASGMAMMIELAKMLNTNPYALGRTVVFVGFGASECTFAGSWYFLNRMFSDVSKIDAMINLDMLGTGSNGFYAYTSSNYDLNVMLKATGNTLQPVLPQVTAKEPYPSDHRSFYSAQIPSVFFTTGQYPEYNTDRDTQSIIEYEQMERELEYIYNFTRELTVVPEPPMFNNEIKSSGPNKTDTRVYAYRDCDKAPTFLGSSDPRKFLSKWVYQYVKYPREALQQGIQGRVMVKFTIGKDGKVKDVLVHKGVNPLLDEEAVKVVSASPQWRPGVVNGQKVDSYIILPVEFILTKKGSFGLKK